MAATTYYEDFAVGQVIDSATYTISKQQAIAFARDYDPQPQHTDVLLAQESMFGRLIVSGWQTAAISMRLKLGTALGQTGDGIIGVGLESVRWPRPVYPGDTLHISITILAMRGSLSQPTRGVVTYQVHTFNQKNEIVMEMTTTILMPRRPTV